MEKKRSLKSSVLIKFILVVYLYKGDKKNKLQLKELGLKQYLQSKIQIFKTARETLKNEGFKALGTKLGKKVLISIIIYYLIRDITLYIIIPYLVFK